MCGCYFISMFVPCNFRLSKLDIRLWLCCISTSPMTMPKTSVYHYGNTIFWQHYIRPSWQLPILQSEPGSTCMQLFPNQKFRFSVLASDTRHAVMPLLDIKFASHDYLLSSTAFFSCGNGSQ